MKCKIEGCDRESILNYDLCEEHIEARFAEQERIRIEEEQKEKRIREPLRKQFLDSGLENWLYRRLGFTLPVAQNATTGLPGRLRNGNSSEVNKVLETFLKQKERLFGGGFWLYGLEGRGKTDLAARIFVELVTRFDRLNPRRFHYTTHRAYMNAVFAATLESTPHEIARLYRANQIICVDELFQASTKAYSFEVFREVIEHIVDRQKTLIVITNRTPGELEAIERSVVGGGAAPVTSRLHAILQLLPITGEDMRRGV